MKRTTSASGSDHASACQAGRQVSASARPVIQAVQPPSTTVTNRNSQAEGSS